MRAVIKVGAFHWEKMKRRWWRRRRVGVRTTSASAVSPPRHPPPPAARIWPQRNPVTSSGSCLGYASDAEMGVASRGTTCSVYINEYLCLAQHDSERSAIGWAQRVLNRTVEVWLITDSSRTTEELLLFILFVFTLDIYFAAQHGRDWSWMRSHLLQNEGYCRRTHRWATKSIMCW